MSESDTQLPRDEESRELSGATRAEGREYVLPANARQPRVSEGLNGHALDRGRVDGRPTNDADAVQRTGSAPSANRPNATWEVLFALPSSSQILARLVDGDPLAIEQRCRARIEHLALLVDLERVVQCTTANAAYFARRYRGAPPFELWMRQRVEAGIERVLEDEAELDRTMHAFDPPTAMHVSLGAKLGMNPRLVRPALVIFNALPLRVRRVFRAVVVEERALAELPDAAFGELAIRERRLRCALSSIGALRPIGVEPETEDSMKSEPRAQPGERRLDPRTEELLREVALNPDSCLLRAPRRELRDALERADYLGLSTQVGLSSAERELLRTARAEVAYWLNVMCFKRLTDDESTRRHCTRLIEGDREYIPPSLDATRAGLAGAIESARDFRVLDAPIEVVLERLIVGDSVQRADVRDLAAASLRLHPTYQARHYAVQATQFLSDKRLSLQLARQLVQLSRGSLERAYAEAQLGQALFRAGDAQSSCERYQFAAELAPELRELKVRGLSVAVETVNRVRAEQLLRAVDDVPGGVLTVRVLCDAFRARQSRLSQDALRLAQRLLERAGTLGTEVLHAVIAS